MGLLPTGLPRLVSLCLCQPLHSLGDFLLSWSLSPQNITYLFQLNSDPGLAQEERRFLTEEAGKREGEREEEEKEKGDSGSTGVTLKAQDSVKSQVCKLQP